MARRILTIVGIVLFIGMIVYLIHRPDTTKKAPCSDDNDPCISITTADKHTFALNDFRFEPNHCISFISLPDKVNRDYCGQYSLSWTKHNNASTKALYD